MAKNSSNVSLFMARNSLEIGQNRRVTTFKERIKADISEAMKARDELRLSTLRMVLSAIQNAEVAGDEAIVLSDDQALAVLRAEAKRALKVRRSMQMQVVPTQRQKSAQNAQ